MLTLLDKILIDQLIIDWNELETPEEYEIMKIMPRIAGDIPWDTRVRMNYAILVFTSSCFHFLF